jgi:hypothetical protein
MIVNFRAREISRDARKLTRTSTLNFKKKKAITLSFLGGTCSDLSRVEPCVVLTDCDGISH